MLLALAIIATLGTVVVGFCIEFANGMSDSPYKRLSHWPTIGLSLLALLLFAGWHFGW